MELIARAQAYLEGKIRKTPIEFSPTLSALMGVPVYLKLESLQVTGSFKVRGALFYLSTLGDEEKRQGVAACSAGNHGLGVAFAAKEMGVACTIFVPKGIDKAKHQKMESLGAHVRASAFPGYDDTLVWAEEEAKKEGLHMITAFDDPRIIAGNGGTLALEIIEQLPSVETVLVPVGGGGLSAGMAHVVKELIGCQHRDSPALHLSLEKGEAFTRLPAVETVAGGIEGGIGALCFEILKDRIHEVALLSEEEIIEGFRWMLANHQYLIEPTAAVAISACLFGKVKLKGTTAIVVTGRNVSFETIKRLLK